MKEIQLRQQRELAEQRQALLAREEAIRSMEARLTAQQSETNSFVSPDGQQ